MKLAHNNILIVMLMLVAFIGQAMASTAVSYSAASCVHGSMNAEMVMMTHTDMMLKDSEQGKNQAAIMDCCQEQCQCPMSGCVSLSLLFNTQFNSEVVSEQKIFQFSSLHQSQINSSLYRPPIS